MDASLLYSYREYVEKKRVLTRCVYVSFDFVSYLYFVNVENACANKIMSQIRISAERSILLTMREPKSANLLLKIFIVITTIIIIIIIITRPLPAYGQHGLAGSSGGDQSGSPVAEKKAKT